MNRLVIIGNGFDMAHGLKTSYMDFINWYWEQRLNALLTERKPYSDDSLCRLEIKNTKKYPDWYNYFYSNSFREPFTGAWKFPPLDIIEYFKGNEEEFSVTYSKFFERIMKSFEEKRWVDIENDYYEMLKKGIDAPPVGYTIKGLNEQMDFLKNKLVEYLNLINSNRVIPRFSNFILDYFHPEDFSTEGKDKVKEIIGRDIECFDEVRKDSKKLEKLRPECIMLLSFNYTNLADLYNGDNIIHNFIHGDLFNPKHIIFGYGDELDRYYPDLRDKNDNELLKNVKSVKYLETSNYRKMLDFLAAAPFQVLIMGHSCGNSDRTLLNTVFEHKNCISIKPYYYVKKDGSDNFLELVQNISRNFTNPKLFRDRVVNKEQCQTM